jgi:hypothetical protein
VKERSPKGFLGIVQSIPTFAMVTETLIGQPVYAGVGTWIDWTWMSAGIVILPT